MCCHGFNHYCRIGKNGLRKWEKPPHYLTPGPSPRQKRGEGCLCGANMIVCTSGSLLFKFCWLLSNCGLNFEIVLKKWFFWTRRYILWSMLQRGTLLQTQLHHLPFSFWRKYPKGGWGWRRAGAWNSICQYHYHRLHLPPQWKHLYIRIIILTLAGKPLMFCTIP